MNNEGSPIVRPNSFVFCTIERASGCSDFLSAIEAISKTRCSAESDLVSFSINAILFTNITFVTWGFPSVNVPVLSKTMVLIFPNNSRLSPPLNMTPCCTALPILPLLQLELPIPMHMDMRPPVQQRLESVPP